MIALYKRNTAPGAHTCSHMLNIERPRDLVNTIITIIINLFKIAILHLFLFFKRE